MNSKSIGGLMRYLRYALCFLLLGMPVLFASSAAFGQVVVSVAIAPPELPVYDQPICPGDGYIWVPGYWAWDGDDYYWVPGTWVLAPEPGLLWTPGYWGFDNDVYVFYAGYWGPHCGYYGGINYGFGYTGDGYEGGYWNNGAFFYNRSVNNITNVNITNVYNKTVVVNNTTINNVSYVGGTGGTSARPTAVQLAAAKERHLPPTPVQVQHEHAAAADPALLVSKNHGAPPIAATSHPAELKGPGVVPAKAVGTMPAAPAGQKAPGGVQPPANAPGTPLKPNPGSKPL